MRAAPYRFYTLYTYIPPAATPWGIINIRYNYDIIIVMSWKYY